MDAIIAQAMGHPDQNSGELPAKFLAFGSRKEHASLVSTARVLRGPEESVPSQTMGPEVRSHPPQAAPQLGPLVRCCSSARPEPTRFVDLNSVGREKRSAPNDVSADCPSSPSRFHRGGAWGYRSKSMPSEVCARAVSRRCSSAVSASVMFAKYASVSAARRSRFS
jgi:hypothetical protein